MYGKITVGFGTLEQKELEIVDFVKAEFKNNRIVSVSQIEDNSFLLAVENIQSTGRNPQSTMWLSEESLIGLLSTAMLYFEIKGQDLKELLARSVSGNNVNYTISDNLDVKE